MIDYTSAANIEGVKRRATLPDNAAALYPDDIICKILTAELHSVIVPLLMSVREDYLLHNSDQDIVSGTNSYEIPSRAVGQKLKDVVLVNSDGRESGISRIDTGNIKDEPLSGSVVSDRGFYFEDDRVVLYPDGASFTQYDLRMKYFRRPNNIIETSSAGKITAINTGSKIVTLDNLPAAWTTATTFDFIKGTPGFKSRADDKAITSLSTVSKTLTFTDSLPDGLIVGDWVAESGFSPIAQIPYDVHNLLEQRAAVKVLEEMGDSGIKGAADVYKDMVDRFMVLVTPRADGSHKKIVSKNPLFGGGSSSRRPPWW